MFLNRIYVCVVPEGEGYDFNEITSVSHQDLYLSLGCQNGVVVL